MLRCRFLRNRTRAIRRVVVDDNQLPIRPRGNKLESCTSRLSRHNRRFRSSLRAGIITLNSNRISSPNAVSVVSVAADDAGCDGSSSTGRPRMGLSFGSSELGRSDTGSYYRKDDQSLECALGWATYNRTARRGCTPHFCSDRLRPRLPPGATRHSRPHVRTQRRRAQPSTSTSSTAASSS